MSRRITNVAGDHLDLASAYPLVPPFTLNIWVKRNTIGVAQQLLNIGFNTSNNDRASVSFQAADSVAAQTVDAATSSQGTSSTLAADNNWHMATAVFVSTNSRAAFLDGAGKGVNAISRVPATPNNIRISGSASGSNRFDGWAAHAAIWDIDLSDSEVLQLFTTDPRQIQSVHLAHYWPLTLNQSPEQDYGFRGEPLIVTGTTFDGAVDIPPLNWIQEAGLIATILRGVSG